MKTIQPIFRWFPAFLLICIGLNSFAQVRTAFTQRTSAFSPTQTIYSINGDYTMIGNTNMTLQNYSASGVNSNSTMIVVDADGIASTNNSSSSTLSFSTENQANPSCSRVLFAGLYWSARTNGTPTELQKRSVKFRGPGQSNYTSYTATANDIKYPGDDNMYVGFTEVTSQVQQCGLGDYWLADMALTTGNGGSTGYYGGWGLVVVYENSKMNKRDVTLFDGYAYVVGGTAQWELPVSGFTTALSGSVNTKLGMMAGEGDITITGDKFEIQKLNSTNWELLGHGGNSSSNFFNSSIFTGGNTRNPSVANNTGMDISMFSIPNPSNSVIGNGQTSTKFRYSSTQDTYIIYSICMAVDAYEPVVEGFLSTLNVNGVPTTSSNLTVQPGDNIQYKVQIRNKGNEAINNARIEIPLPYAAIRYQGSSVNVFSPASSSALPYVDATLGANGTLIWDFGTLPLPSNPNTVLGELTFTLKVTEDCELYRNFNCSAPNVQIDGTISGIGANTGISVDDQPFYVGFSNVDGCTSEPLTGPFNININSTEWITANCAVTDGIRDFTYCNRTTAIPVTDVIGFYPNGTRFFNANQTVEYTVANPFPILAGPTTYRALLPGTSCLLSFTIGITTISSLPTVSASTLEYCKNNEALALIATPSNPTYQLFYYAPGSSIAQPLLIPSTLEAGNFVYQVAEGPSSTCISTVRKNIPVQINALPTITATASQIACFGGTGSVELTSNGGTGALTYASSNPTTSGLTAASYTYSVSDSKGCEASATAVINAAPAQTGQPTLACWESATWNVATCSWDVTGSQAPAPTTACYETATFNTSTCGWDVTGTQAPAPTTACYETATFNTLTCGWDVTGTQAPAPTTACYETATFNTSTCGWDVTGSQEPAPTNLSCWQTATFNTTSCDWDVTGTQAPAPTNLDCWQTATFNTTSCSWDVTGTQTPAPTNLSCWQTATFNTTSCDWDVTGTQAPAPTNLSCWQTATFNTTSCGWDVTGTQPAGDFVNPNAIPTVTTDLFSVSPSVEARARWGASGFEAVLFTPANPGPPPNGVGLNLDPSGAPVWGDGLTRNFKFTYNASTGASTWSIDWNNDLTFGVGEIISSSSSALVNKGFNYVNIFLQGANVTAPATGASVTVQNLSINGANFGTFSANNSTIVSQNIKNSSGVFGDITATGNITFVNGSGTLQERPRFWIQLGQPVTIQTQNCWDNYVFNNVSCQWENIGTQEPAPTNLACWQTAAFNTTSCAWDVTGTQAPAPTNLSCYQTATFNTTSCAWDVTGSSPVAITSVTGESPLCVGGNANYSANGVVLGGGLGAWSSSNLSVASVDASSGSVTALGAGNTNIVYTITAPCGTGSGRTWETRTSASDLNWQSVAYNGSKFVAVGRPSTGNTDAVMTSANGDNWTNVPHGLGPRNFNDVIYANNMFVAVSSDVQTSGGTQGSAMYSADGNSWTLATAPRGDWQSVAYGNGTFVAVASFAIPTKTKVMTSTDGINWTSRIPSSTTNIWRGVTFGNGIFVAVSTSGNANIMTSPNGIDWTAVTPPGNAAAWAVAYGNGKFVAVSQSGAVMTSTDGSSWTIQTSAASIAWNDVTFADGVFVAVASSGTGNRIMTSADGIIWLSEASAADNKWNGITYGNGKFVVVGETGTGNRVMVSSVAAGTITVSAQQTLTVNPTPAQPTNLSCWQTATFNTTSCAWDVTGTQAPAPTNLSCWESASFNTETCGWDVTGTQAPAPTNLACWQTATFNTTSCGWDVSGTQAPAPTNLSCWQTATFNTTSCAWDVTGTQAPAPTNLACWQTATFNTTSCTWVVTGTQPQAIVTNASACGSYTWAANSQQYTSSGTYSYSANCQDYSLNLTINNSSVAASSISTASTSVNPSATFTLSVVGGSLGTGATWKWYKTSCGGTAIGTGASISVSQTVATTYFVRAEGTCGMTDCKSITINMNCGPTSITSNRPANTVCKGTSITLTVQGTVGTGGSWKWYKGGCGVGTICATGSSITVTPTANTTYFVRSTGSTCGTTVCQSISVIVNSAPATPGTISGSTVGLCGATAAQYSVVPVSGATTYTWTVPTGAVITAGQGTNVITVNFAGASNSSCSSSSTISVKASNSCGTSSTKTLTIGLRPAKATAINGSATACKLSVVTYSVNPIAGATSYTWTVPTGWVIQAGQGTANVTIKTGTCSGSIGVTANSICGNNGCFTKSITLSNCARYAEDNTNLEEEITTVDNISIYPNPGFGEYTIVTPSLDETAVVSVYAMDGRLVSTLNVPAQSKTIELHLNDVAKGIYLVRFVSTSLSQDIRVIKQ